MKKWICSLWLVLFAGMAEAAPVPILDLSVDVAAWLESVPEETATNDLCGVLTSLGISNVAVSMTVDDAQILTAVKIGTTLVDAREAWLSQTNAMQLEAVSENEYKWIPEDPEDLALILVEDDLRIRFSGSTVMMGTQGSFPSAEELEFNTGKGSLLQGAVQVEPLLKPLLAAFQKMVDAEEEGFGKAIMSAILTSLKTSAAVIQEITSASFAVSMPDSDTRTMTLSLEYQTADAAAGTTAFFHNSNQAWKNPDISEKQLSLAGLIDTPFFQGMSREGNKIQFSYEWMYAEDSALLKVIGQAVSGSLFSFGDKDAFPVNPEKTMEAPNLGNVNRFDTVQFEKDFRAALFYENRWKTHITLAVDYLDIPNADLLSAELTNVSILGTNGAQLARQERPGSFRINSANKSASISLSTESDGAAAETASFSLEFKIPTIIEKYTLTKKDPLVESGDTGCCLIAMSNSVVSLRSKGLSLREAKVYALNAAGDYLTHAGASWSDSNYRGNYNGTPAAVELVFPQNSESITLDFKDIAVRKEDKLQMPKHPTNCVVTRYTLEPLETWSSLDIEAITASTMTFVTNAGWKKNEYQLQFPKPAGVKTKTLTMRSYLAGIDEWLNRGEGSGSSSSGNHFYWDLKHTNTVNAASAIFGEVEGCFWSGVGTYTANVSTNPVPLIAGHELPAVRVEHNVVWIESEKEGQVLEIMAFDETGRRLKKGSRMTSRMSSRGYYFWGQPRRVTVVYASSKETITVPFEIELKAGGLEAIPATREKIEAFEEQLEFVKKIGNKARGRYGNLLSAFYYAHNSNHEPVACIPLEVAHSDPVGASVFGYDPKPCKGYFLRKISLKKRPGKEVKKTTCTWAGGSFEATYDDALLLALPADKKNPAILLRWSDVYVNYNDCSKMEQVPSQTSELEAAGWIKIR